ncbi:hypothetical protein AB0K00_14145 [Dactylosporangium sp. NPDC049525]|uniref:hypothetical protein n=1 Tax=Dactylosporangium sp. NPDC049525 TaxID=3154730 RepID=UPI0034219291
MGWGPVARPGRPERLLTVLLLALAVSWLAVGGAARTVHNVTASRTAYNVTAARTVHNVTADRGGPSASTQQADTECQPGGPTRCDHGADHRTTGRLHPSVTSHDRGGTGYPAGDPSAAVDRDSPAGRPPDRPSLAELQVWRR